MKVLVTGSTGFVASHLVPALARDGYEVIAVGHDPSRIPSHPGVRQVVLDLAGAFQASDLPACDAIVHLAQANARFPEGADALFAVNTGSTQRLLEYARHVGASRFVLASSGSVYGTSDSVLAESSPLHATDFYGATKIAAERLVSAYEGILDPAILRIFVPYGPGQSNRMIPAIVSRVRSGEPVTLNGGGRPFMNPTYVGDVVRVVRRCLDTHGPLLLNVGGPDVVDVRGLAEVIGQTLGIDPVFVDGNAEVAGDIVADISRMRELLGNDGLVSLDDGLRLTLEPGPGS